MTESIDFEVTITFEQVGKFASKETMNNEGHLCQYKHRGFYLLNVLQFTVVTMLSEDPKSQFGEGESH